MVWLLLGVAWATHPFELVRVDDPEHPAAIARSETGAVLIGPPEPGVRWSWESVPEVDGWPAEEALEVMNIPLWQTRGARGQGVKVAVFDVQWFGAEADPDDLGEVITHDCWTHMSCEPSMDTLQPRFTFEDGVHGFACAQVVHDLAPEAELHLVRVNGQTTLENAVEWAIREGIDIISMSMSFFNDSFYDGTGPISAMMARLHEAGILMVTSSGNYADSHWQGHFVDGDLDGVLDFDGEERLRLWLPAGASRGVYLSWDQYRTCGTTDFDAYLLDDSGNVIGASEDVQDAEADHCAPVERLRGDVPEDGWYWIEVVHRRGPVAGLRIDVLGTRGDFAHTMPQGSIADPGVSPYVFTVGAVRADGYLLNDIEAFSSQGPTAAGLSKPDIAGPDGLSTTAFGAVGFYGTSAATPAVAGALAVVMSDEPGLTPFEAARRMQGWAAGDGATFSAPDPRWGAGRARLPADAEVPSPCGRRPLLLPLVLLPVGWFRRKQRSG